MFRTLFLALSALLLAAGCSGVRDIQIPSDEEGDWVSESGGANPSRMYVRRQEAKYVIKPEPYSVNSKKKDPELLGPQRTYQSGTSPRTTTPAHSKRSHARMTKASCVSMIGETKYNSYVKRYGGEKGALRRCLILKRLKG